MFLGIQIGVDYILLREVLTVRVGMKMQSPAIVVRTVETMHSGRNLTT